MIKLLRHIVRFNKERNIEDYLFTYFVRSIDNRIIIRIGYEWKTNGNWNSTKNSIERILNDNYKDAISSLKIQKILERTKIYYDKIEEMEPNTRMYKATFVNKNLPQTQHDVYLEAHKNDKTVGYQTEYESAYAKNYWGNEVIINKYQGKSKPSVLLEYNIDKLKQETEEKKVSSLKQAHGALLYGHNEDIISPKYKNTIDYLNKESIIYRNDLLDMGIEDAKNLEYLITSDIVKNFKIKDQ